MTLAHNPFTRKKRPMQIDQPKGIVPCRCGTQDAVCVKGQGAVDGNQTARWVYARIYQPPDGPPDPAVPPTDAARTVPQSDGTWCIGYLEGAVCAPLSSSSSSSPLPQNKIYAWAEFVGQSGLYYLTDDCMFQGVCQTNLPECCNSSSSTG